MPTGRLLPQPPVAMALSQQLLQLPLPQLLQLQLPQLLQLQLLPLQSWPPKR